MVVGDLQGMKGSRMESLGWLHLKKKHPKESPPKKNMKKHNYIFLEVQIFPTYFVGGSISHRDDSKKTFKPWFQNHCRAPFRFNNLRQFGPFATKKKSGDKFWNGFWTKFTLGWHFLGGRWGRCLFGRKGVRVSQHFTKYGGLCRIYFGDGRSSGWNSWLSCWWVAKRFQINMIWQLAAFFWHEFLHRFSCHSSLALLVRRRPSSAQQSHLCDRRHFL